MKGFYNWLAAGCLIVAQASPTLATESNGAKGLYFSQLDRPAQNINTGIQYWIEVSRNNNVSKVNNKTVFHSGDKLRVHVTPNIDGYAYILLRSGSRGEQAVLFPDPQQNEDNHVQHGKDYVLPNDGALKFDQNPGIEKLTLLLSRTPIDSKVYLAGPADGKLTPLVASIDCGSKDLIPSEILVSYVQPGTSPKVASDITESSSSSSTEKNKNSQPSKKQTTLSHRTKQTTTTKVVHKPVAQDSGVTTVVYKDPSGVLAVDISLEHK